MLPEEIQKAVDEATAGLKANRDEILAEKRALKEELEKQRGSLQEFEALRKQLTDLGDVEGLKQLVLRAKNDKATRMLTEGKVDEFLAQHTEAMRKDYEARHQAMATQAGELEKTLAGHRARVAELTLGTMLDEATRKAECTPTALADIKRAAAEIFRVSDDGSVEARGRDGVLIPGKEGKPLTPAEWIDSQRQHCPHWWAPSKGGGAAGAMYKGVVIDAKKLETMSAHEKLSLAIQERM